MIEIMTVKELIDKLSNIAINQTVPYDLCAVDTESIRIDRMFECLEKLDPDQKVEVVTTIPTTNRFPYLDITVSRLPHNSGSTVKNTEEIDSLGDDKNGGDYVRSLYCGRNH